MNTDNNLQFEIFLFQCLKIPDELTLQLVCNSNHRFGNTPEAWKGWAEVTECPHAAWLNRIALPSSSFRLCHSSSFCEFAKAQEGLFNESLLEAAKDTPLASASVQSPSAALVANAHGQFMLVYRFQVSMAPEALPTLEPGPNSRSQTLGGIFFELEDRKDSGFLALIHDSTWGQKLMSLANEEIVSVLSKLTQFSAGKKQLLSIEDKVVHALTLSQGNIPEAHLHSIHSQEEPGVLEEVTGPIAKDYPGSSIRFGWSFSTLHNVPSEDAATHFVGPVFYIQLSWYTMRFYRSKALELSDERIQFIENRQQVSDSYHELEDLTLAYQRYVIDHRRYRSSLNPKRSSAFQPIEKTWKLEDDFLLIQDALIQMRDSVSRRIDYYSAQDQYRIQLILFVVGLTQILALVGVVSSYSDLVHNPTHSADKGLYKFLGPEVSQTFHTYLPVFLILVLLGLILIAALYSKRRSRTKYLERRSKTAWNRAAKQS